MPFATMPLKEKLDVFLSSALEEFKNERRTLSERISRIPFLDCVPLEERGADTSSVEEASVEGVKECDIYIGVFGSQYSEITIKEFREALKRRKLCLNYVKRTSRRDTKLQNFIEMELKPQFKYHEFKSKNDLYSIVTSDLEKHLKRLLRMGLRHLKDSKKQALATQAELRPVLTKAIKEQEETRPLLIINEAHLSFIRGNLMMATIEAAVALELAGRLALMRKGVSLSELKKASLGKILQLLQSYKMLDLRDVGELQELTYLRNAAVHEGKSPSTITVKWVLRVAEEAIEKLQKLR